ncbi:adenylate/guanylate cyclase domain-containing protein [Ruegeria marina]|uniref:Adenylate cyclase, class 3 n=1 Tax=Ruegeria marina TaxID=639004 RepID=A0A1G7AZ11_9RHOB|nr:adenylate/guanylate cyclase domain-containing protein [Ruegeria marina]SDE20023.1 Adenylate cyclase, class 3 [Ruegeria marina]
MSGVKPSPELLAVARRWIDAVPNRRPNELRNLLTEHPYLRFVGTGENELWAGAAIREGIGDFFGAIPELLKHEETFAEAYENDGTGWACMCHELVLAHQPDRSFTIRSTLIFTLEDGAWKIVHRHGSLPFSNLEFVGSEQTAIADLVAAAQNGFSLDQRSGFASIMFTDIVNSSRLAEVMGDRLWSAEVARHFAALRRIIEKGGGQFVKSLGDGTMSSFPSPGDALEAARGIMAASRQSDGPAIVLRIGIHTGDVVQSENDFFGTVVNKAARIATLAHPGEIRVSDATRKMLGETAGLAFTDTVSVPLKGLDGEHLVHRLEWRE